MKSWNFPVNNGGEFHGIGDSGIDIFKGEPVKSLTREICQNSIDAGIDKGNIPVKVEFSLFEVPLAKIPECKELKKYFELARDFTEQQNFEKAKKYFDKSMPIFDEDSISILRVSDFNTTGLPGAKTADRDFTTPWFRLVRSVGSSDKGEGAIGSYGTGKKAAFACSDLQTVFYSTYVEDEGYAYQGVTKLIDFEDEKGTMHSDVGYYSESNSMPVLCEFDLDNSFKRETPGTDVYIIGFKFCGQDWIKRIISSVLDGFFYAIKEDNLVVEVGDYKIDSKSIENFINKYNGVKDGIDDKTYDYYKVMTSENTTKREYSCMEENDVEIQMLLDSDLHKRTAIVRYPGMKVFDRGYLSKTISFAGVCIIKGKEIAKLLGGLENIQHNKWDLSRYDDDPVLQEEADAQIHLIYDHLKDLFTELRGEDTEGEIDPEIGDCLPDPVSENDEKQDAINDEIINISGGKETNTHIPYSVNIEDETGTEARAGDDEKGSGGESKTERGSDFGPNGSNPGPVSGGDSGNNPPYNDEEGKATRAKLVRANIEYRDLDYQKGQYRLWIKPHTDLKDGVIEIYMGAEDDAYKARLVNASMSGGSLVIDGNKIKDINISRDTEAEINVQMDYDDICSLEVKIYGY